MAFTRIALPSEVGAGEDLAADNPLPDRFTILDILRRAAPSLGLKPAVLTTLGALLSFLPPRRNHHIVFASNATLCTRLDGLSERTLRRHCAVLEEIGLLHRHDSPNRKRFSRRDPRSGLCLRFGFDLEPLFVRLSELVLLAAEADQLADHLRFLKLRLRAAIVRALIRDPDDRYALAAKPSLRRNISCEAIEALLHTLPDTLDANRTDTERTPFEASTLAGTDGQNDRHYQESKKEQIDNSDPDCEPSPAAIPRPEQQLHTLLAVCPEPLAFATEPIETPADAIRLGTILAPMIGINPSRYAEAQHRRGHFAAALGVWIIVSLGTRVRHPGRYFESLLNGVHSATFEPWSYLDRMSKRHHAGRVREDLSTQAALT